MLFIILNIFFQALIVVFLIRFFIERYRFYGFGPILVAIVTLTERILRPLKQALPRSAMTLQDSTPLAAIVVVLLIRGFLIWLLQASTGHIFLQMHRLGGNQSLNLLQCTAVSFAMGATLLSALLIAFLFASVMISRRGIAAYGNAGFACFQERTFAIFRWVGKMAPTENLVWLFIFSASVIWLAGGLFATLINGTPFYGIQITTVTFIATLFDLLMTLIYVYWFVLLIAIITNWIGADQLSLVVQIVRALADPYLDIFRRLFPWARIDFLDLSPIFAFLVLNPVLVYALFSLQEMLIASLAPATTLNFY